MLKKFCLMVVTFVFITFGMTSAQAASMSTKEALSAIDGAKNSYSAVSDELLAQILQAVGQLTNAINTKAITLKEEVRFRSARAYGLIRVNEYKLEYEMTPDTEKAAMALADLDFVLQVNNVRIDSNIGFYAGYVALNHLDYAPLAFRYWEKCATMGHAGCINILAEEYFVGSKITADFEASVKWHEKSFLTGARYNCAVFHSLNSLITLSFFFPDASKEHTWLDWVGKRPELSEQFKQNSKGKSDCMSDDVYVLDFIFKKLSNLPKEISAEEILEKVTYTELRTLFQSLSTDTKPEEIKDDIAALDDPDYQCFALVMTAIYANHIGNDEVLREMENQVTLYNSISCERDVALFRHLQTSGQL
jgi:hypothetical protein